MLRPKKILRPDRWRPVPAPFSWLDQRRVRENFLRRAEPAAWALSRVLVTVADAPGRRYYADATWSRLLQWAPLALAHARQQLVAADLVAYQKPLYQVRALPLAAAASAPSGTRRGRALSAGDLLRRAVEGGAA